MNTHPPHLIWPPQPFASFQRWLLPLFFLSLLVSCFCWCSVFAFIRPIMFLWDLCVEFSLWCWKSLLIDCLSEELDAAVTFQLWSTAPSDTSADISLKTLRRTVTLIDQDGTLQISAHMRKFEDFLLVVNVHYVLASASLISSLVRKAHQVNVWMANRKKQVLVNAAVELSLTVCSRLSKQLLQNYIFSFIDLKINSPFFKNPSINAELSYQ